MNFEEWEHEMLAKGYQKFFLGDVAKGSLASFAESLHKLKNLSDASSAAILEETTELKANAIKFGVKPMIPIIEDFESHMKDNNHDECAKLIGDLVCVLKDFKKMLIDNCD
ncbi:MAG: hypothetical protein NE334_06205 [Lentisphaeraceae bacterium]|nr:hypothetical protein [Lentisphaeraceae bacterium]